MSHRKALATVIAVLAAIAVTGYASYRLWFAPTRILVVNALPAQEAELRLSADRSVAVVTSVAMEDAGDFDRYDAVLLYGRGLYLDSLQRQSLDAAAGDGGVMVYTNTLRRPSVVINCNIDSAGIRRLDRYFRNQCRANYRNLIRYVRSVATPRRICRTGWEEPVELPDNMLYHLEEGRYFTSASGLEDYLRERGLYHEGGRKVAFISGVSFPVEGIRDHIDSLLSRLTTAGFNVYPISASGRQRASMIKEIDPDAIIYLPMGRIGNDSLVSWIYGNDIPMFMPFPLTQSREEWLDVDRPIEGGTLNARVVIPEIDGAMAPVCLSTQNPTAGGQLVPVAERERIDAFMEQFVRYMNLRSIPNSRKRVAIAYFKSPGKDALLASGMEVIPSLYNFLKRLCSEGYDLSGLPASLAEFKRQVMLHGAVMGDYAPWAQMNFMNEASPLWIDAATYERWAREILFPEKYEEVLMKYGKAPGSLLARGDSIAMACLRYGNVLLFPQPRPAIGDDDFKMVHGADVPPPHSYLAPYLYMQKGFDADLLIHFGTHGNLEFTPGKNVGLSGADWADALIGNRPHFYFYTTANVGESVIAKRRSRAVMVSHLPPPYVESGMRARYSGLIERIHAAIADPSKSDMSLRNEIVALGLHSDLGISASSSSPLGEDDLRKVDMFVEELANEKITGAYYVMGQQYSPSDLATTVTAISADPLAYARAERDRKSGRISESQLKDYSYIAHRYLPAAKSDIARMVATGGTGTDELADAADCLRLLRESPDAEFDAMIGAMSGIPVRPAPGGDPVLNPNVLPTGRNMYSINPEATPGRKAWADGVALADETLREYMAAHGEYPQKVSYTFWAGEFISSQGATLAQALRMLGVEPVRDEQDRVMGLRLTPSDQLGRPRINVMIQVSGQLRDIAGSRLKLLTEAVRMASEAEGDIYPNYVAQASSEQEKKLLGGGLDPEKAAKLSVMRVFGPVNSGYSTGMLSYTENSGEWDDRDELVAGFVNNMCAMYGDDDNWGVADPQLFSDAISGTGLVVQPRQSNTWGPISLDHVYEFTGALSLAVDKMDGREPDALMADYRNPYLPRVQNAKEAVAVETRATILNPVYIKERMKGDATTAQMFGEIFRNIFGWTVMRRSVLGENIYDDLYEMYIEDVNDLGIRDYFDRVNPAALQEMTATMLESARKGYWNASQQQLESIAGLSAEMTDRHGAPCTEFVCGNPKLQEFTASLLDPGRAVRYRASMAAPIDADIEGDALKKAMSGGGVTVVETGFAGIIMLLAVMILAIIGIVLYIRRK